MSIMLSQAKATGLIAAATPSTRRMLKILEPMTFPSAISTSSFLAATMEVTSSGRLVPMAIMVSPINVWLSPRRTAIAEAPSTTKSPPYLIAIIPPRMKMRHFHAGRRLICDVTCSISSSEREILSSCIEEIASGVVVRRALLTERIIQSRYPVNIIRKRIPSIRPSVIPRYPSSSKSPAQKIDNGNSFCKVLF